MGGLFFSDYAFQISEVSSLFDDHRGALLIHLFDDDVHLIVHFILTNVKIRNTLRCILHQFHGTGMLCVSRIKSVSGITDLPKRLA